jgi:hypothetical protein
MVGFRCINIHPGLPGYMQKIPAGKQLGRRALTL